MPPSSAGSCYRRCWRSSAIVRGACPAAARDGGEAARALASAKHPGGGFRTGAQAQEEDIARASALYSCLTAVPQFYTLHRSRPDTLYSDSVIYSPHVP